MKTVIVKIALAGLIIMMFSCNPKTEKSPIIEEEEVVDSEDETANTPQITNIKKTPDILTKEIKTYTVTLITESKGVKLDDTEFSIDGKNWQKTGKFKDVTGGKYTFYARNKRNKSLQDLKEMYFEEYVNVPVPTKEQLNNYLKLIAEYNDEAIDSMRKCLGNDCIVKGTGNINDVRELILETQKGISFSVTNIELAGDLIKAITVSKN